MTDASSDASLDASTEPGAARDAAALWLAAHHRMAGRASHEVKNALNGVSVNLAVVQSRVRRQQAPELVTRFADSAVAQLELLTRQIEALLAFARPPRAPADVALVARQVSTLAGAAGSADPLLTVDAPSDGVACTRVDGLTVRALVVGVLTSALDDPGGCQCVITAEDGGAVRLAVRTAGALAVGDELAALARAAGVDAQRRAPGEFVLGFPPARGRRDLISGHG